MDKDAVFVSGLSGDTARYRCFNQGEAFGLAGGTYDVRLRRSTELADLVDSYRCFVLHRVPWDRDVARLLDAARECGKPVVFDADDLVFDPSVRNRLPLERLEEEGRRLVLAELDGCGRTLAAADVATLSTEALAARARAFNERVAISPNVASAEMVEAADRALREGPARADASVTIAYLSGTPTHERDFLEAADAVLWALETFAETRFLAVGPLELDDRFDRFPGRVDRLPRRPWQELPELLASVDVNLAPLERGNPFTEAKSCVKYIEAALVAVPTIASPRQDFARAIEHGANGVLADGPGSWRESLGRVVESRELRVRLGRAAHEDVRANHTTAARSTAVHELLGGLIAAGRLPA